MPWPCRMRWRNWVWLRGCRLPSPWPRWPRPSSAAALRANEIGAEVILKATKVDGIYDSDPKKNSKARRFSQISYLEALKQQLKVMDSTAFSLCMDNKMPIIVFDLFRPHNLRRVVMGEKVGTLVTG